MALQCFSASAASLAAAVATILFAGSMALPAIHFGTGGGGFGAGGLSGGSAVR